ncbi:MAG: hypothetical protein M3Z31_18095, partial [Pseudomonadota bacterium]|nr:hypothetical protein [Pseudomonadota bacterium]
QGAAQRRVGEAAHVVELARQLAFDDLDELVSPLADIVLSSPSPRAAAPLAFMLLGSHWQLP